MKGFECIIIKYVFFFGKETGKNERRLTDLSRKKKMKSEVQLRKNK